MHKACIDKHASDKHLCWLAMSYLIKESWSTVLYAVLQRVNTTDNIQFDFKIPVVEVNMRKAHLVI